MIAKLEKISDLKYVDYLALTLIEKDEDLCNMFKEDVTTSFEIIRTDIKDGKLSEPIQNLIFGYFDKIILSKQFYIKKYKKLLIDEGLEIEEKIIESIEEKTSEEELSSKPKKIKKPSALPKRYGLVKIREDIEKQGGKATNAQLTAIALNDLKNMWGVINSRLIKDMMLEDKILTDEDYRDIRSTVKIAQNKLRDVLKKK